AVEPRDRRPSFARTFQIMVSGYGINFVTPFVQLGGEPYRVAALTPWLGMSRAAGAVILYFMLHAASNIVLWAAGALLTLTVPGIDRGTAVTALVLLVFILGLAFLLWRAHLKGGLQTILDLASRLPLLNRIARRLEPRRATLAAIDRQITDFYHRTPNLLRAALALELLARALIAVEIMIIGQATRVPVSFTHAVIVTGFAGLVINATFFVPFMLGTWEGSFVASYAMLGLSPRLGLAVGFITRLRELCWVGIGLLLLLLPGTRGPRPATPTRSSPAASS
ncbi:MAG TPA: lysylphosphatidylglycerol synthase transmembrane domain-containing protein, partial [Dongiaceae bacterium]|nr:lysylphosphatidylglycerol synthase transmembrane domain-containing protein [Dongiaceae bacterium]